MAATTVEVGLVNPVLAATIRRPGHWFQAHGTIERNNFMGAIAVVLCAPLTLISTDDAVEPDCGLQVGGYVAALRHGSL